MSVERRERSQINLGVIGRGNIGGGVVDYFQEGKGKPFGVHLRRVAVRDLSKHQGLGLDDLLTKRVEDIFEDPEINVVVELIGGLDPARAYIETAMSKGKSVVTANKAVMAAYAKDLFAKARRSSVDLAFEASVGGGIPIINTINRYKGERIERVLGVLNGTTNFILTRMEEGLDFEEALKIAQDRGFAEANHLLDTGGFDTRDKLSLLASLIFNAQVDPDSVTCRGITDITPVDIDFAARYGVSEGGPGYAIKLLAIADRKNGAVELRVNPALVRRDHPLASVRDEVNAVMIEGELAGPQTFSGRGAGTKATTSAVVSDILRVADNIQRGVVDDLPKLDAKVKFVSPKEHEHKGYIRVNLKHIPGSLNAVSRVFSRHGLNVIDSTQQSGFRYEAGGEIYIPDIITFEPTTQRVIDAVLADLGKSDRTHGTPFFLSIVG